MRPTRDPEPPTDSPSRSRAAGGIGPIIPVAAAIGWFLLAGLAGAADPVDSLHTWTSRAGSSVEARLVDLDAEAVVLETADGRRLTLARNQLAPESLVLLEQLDPYGSVTETDDRLPVFAAGPLKGFHTAYRRPGFIAKVDQNGHILVDMLDGGKVASTKPLHIRPGLGYVITQEWHGRAIESVSADSAPSAHSDEVRLHGTAADGVAWELLYEFKDDRISAWGSATDPKDVEAPTIFQVSCHIPKHDGLDYTRPEAEILAAVGDSRLTIKKSRGRPLVFDYLTRQLLGKAVAEAEGEAERATVVSSLFAGRPIEWDPNGTRHGSLLFWSDGNTALWEGYTIYYRNREAGETSRQARLTLTIGDGEAAGGR